MLSTEGMNTWEMSYQRAIILLENVGQNVVSGCLSVCQFSVQCGTLSSCFFNNTYKLADFSSSESLLIYLFAEFVVLFRKQSLRV